MGRAGWQSGWVCRAGVRIAEVVLVAGQVGSLRGSDDERNINRKMIKELSMDLVSMR